MKIKKADGTTEEVSDDYELLEGEEKVESDEGNEDDDEGEEE